MDTTAIDNAQTPGSFDVLAFIESTAYPTKTVVVFQDVRSATEYVKLNTEKAALTDEQVVEKTSLTERMEELAAKITASALTFELRGIAPGIVSDILMPDGVIDEDDAKSQERSDKLVSKTIIGVTNAKGARDTRVWTTEDVTKLRRALKEGEFAKLSAGVSEVNFNALVFDQATDAGFSGGRSDVAE